MPVKNVIKLRQGISSQWNSTNPILASGEPGYDLTNNILKIGNGISSWSGLYPINSINSILNAGNNRLLISDGSTSGIIARSNLYLSGNNQNILNIISTTGVNNQPTLSIGGIGQASNQSEPSSSFLTMGRLLINKQDQVFVDIDAKGFSRNNNNFTTSKMSIYNGDIEISHGSIIATNGSGIFNNLDIGSFVNIADGSLKIYNNNNSALILEPSGFRLIDNNILLEPIQVSQVDTNLAPNAYTPSGFLSVSGAFVEQNGSPFPTLPGDGDTVLFSNFENTINNGIYTLNIIYDSNDNPIPNKFQAVRKTEYSNGTFISNGYPVITSAKTRFILNRNSIGDSVIGVHPLIFTIDNGGPVMQMLPSRDVEFAESVFAKAKYFRIKHPDPYSAYSILQYGSLESPYNGIRLTGQNQLKKGVCIVELPSYIKYLVKETNINIQLTNIKHHKTLFIDNIDISNNRFIVKGYRSKTGGPFEFFWTFTGERKDIDPLIVEQ